MRSPRDPHAIGLFRRSIARVRACGGPALAIALLATAVLAAPAPGSTGSGPRGAADAPQVDSTASGPAGAAATAPPGASPIAKESNQPGGGRAGASGAGAEPPGIPRAQLLDFAREVASAIPLDPHARDRARALQIVCAAALRCGDIRTAAATAADIPNWRRGVAFAELALDAARRGDAEAAQRFLVEAGRAEADSTGDVERGQAWRRDRIRVAMAQVHELLGAGEEAARLEAGVVSAEVGKVEAIRAGTAPSDRVDERLAALDALLAQGTFDAVRNACHALTELHRRHHSQADRRSAAEQRIRGAWSVLPVTERVSLLLALAAGATAGGDAPRAVALVGEARDVVASQRWLPEDEVPLLASIAAALAAAGDPEGAARTAAEAGATYERSREGIVDVFRAAALRPLAEALATIGDRAQSLRVYRMAIEDGSLNPNARPRALDLSATSASMAIAGIEPDADLWARMQAIGASLGAPW